MNDLTAAVGLAQLKINLFNKRKFDFKKYLNGIKDLKYIKPVFPHDPKNGFIGYFQ